MKKKGLKNLKLNKKTISNLDASKSKGGGITGWFCHSDMSECLCSGYNTCNPTPLQTNEGPCPGGTAGCNTVNNDIP